MTRSKPPHDPMTGPLVPVGKDGVVVVQNPPEAPMHLTLSADKALLLCAAVCACSIVRAVFRRSAIPS